MNTEQLSQKAKEIRRAAFEMALQGKTGHLGGSFSCADILVALYYGGIMRYDPRNAHWEDRDRFILSKGHANNTLYALLADVGYFPAALISGYATNGSFLGNHSDKKVPGVEVITGSLGHGLGIAAGIALGAKLDGKDYRVFVILGDGECQEGSVWEAAMFAGQHGLNNMIAFLDRNRLGSEDFTENTAKLDPLAKKWEAFGWDVVSIDGHNFNEIIDAVEQHRTGASPNPRMIIANTVKGKGISFLENLPKSHHTLPAGDEILMARRELS